MNIFPLSLNYITKLPHTILKALSCSVDYVYLGNKRMIMNIVVNSPHFVLLSVGPMS